MSDKVEFYHCHPDGPMGDLVPDVLDRALTRFCKREFARREIPEQVRWSTVVAGLSLEERQALSLNMQRGWRIPAEVLTLFERCVLDGSASLQETAHVALAEYDRETFFIEPPSSLGQAVRLLYTHEVAADWLPYPPADDSLLKASRWSGLGARLSPLGGALLSSLLQGRDLRWVSPEESLLERAITLEDDPRARAEARAVYADWLEARGHQRAALFLQSLGGAYRYTYHLDPMWCSRVGQGEFELLASDYADMIPCYFALGYWTLEECSMLLNQLPKPGLALQDEDNDDDDDETALNETRRQLERSVRRGLGLVTVIR